MPPLPEPTGHRQSGRHPRCRRPPLGTRRPAPGVRERGRHQQPSRPVGSPGAIPTALPVLRVLRPLAPEHAHQHEPVPPAAGGAVLRRREHQPPMRLGAPATGRPTECLSHGQRGSVSPAAPALAGRGDACGAPTLKSRGLSHSGTASAKGVAALASADADGSRGLPQSLGVIVHSGGAWAPSLRGYSPCAPPLVR